MIPKQETGGWPIEGRQRAAPSGLVCCAQDHSSAASSESADRRPDGAAMLAITKLR